MSICPVPFNAQKTDYSKPGSFIATAPDPKYEFCEGGTTSVVVGPGNIVPETVCCPSPGPDGPQGCGLSWQRQWEIGKKYSFESGIPCVTSLVSHDGITYIAVTDNTASADNEPGKGKDWRNDWDIFGSAVAGAMVWKGDWLPDVDYKVNDVVRNNIYTSLNTRAEGYGNAYVCVLEHTSALTSLQPPDAVYWAPATDVGTNEEDKTFLDELRDSVFDWVKDSVDNGDWLQLLAAGVGVAVAGAAIVDMFTEDGKGDGQADSRFNGTGAYGGTFSAPNVRQVVASVMTYGGYNSNQYDVSLLPTDKNVHCTIASTMSLRNFLSTLAQTYQFDIVPSGGMVKFVPMYQPSVRTLTLADLGHKVMGDSDVSGNSPYTAKRIQGIDLPRSVTLNYYSDEIEHNAFSQVSSLDTFEEGQDVKLEIPFTLTDEEALRIAETTLNNAHNEQQQYTFTTDYYNLDLEPGDVITLPLDSGKTTDVRIVQVSSTDDGILEFTAVCCDGNTRSFVGSGVQPTAPASQITNIPITIGYSNTLFVEVPPLNDQDLAPRIFAVIHGYGAAGWPGATLFSSVDSGATYQSTTQSSTIVTMGMAQTITAAPLNDNYHVWDTNTVITVKLKQGSLVSAPSELAVQNGENWAMLGNELIGFRDVTLIDADTYELRHLMRGRQGSEPNIGTHVADELFIVISKDLPTLKLSQSDIGKTVKYKTVTAGSDIAKATAVDVKPYGLNLRPWRVAQPSVVRNQSNGDWDMKWIERPRLVNEMRDYTEIEHDTDWAGYAVAVYKGTEVVRTATAINPWFNYTTSMQIADFGEVQSNLKISVVQMSRTMGGGYPYIIEA